MKRGEITELACTRQLAHWLLINKHLSACQMFWISFKRPFFTGTEQRRQTTSEGTNLLSTQAGKSQEKKEGGGERLPPNGFTCMDGYSITCVNVICPSCIGITVLQISIFIKFLFTFHQLIQDPEELQKRVFCSCESARHLSSSSK